MKATKLKGEALYQKLKASRESLVKRYTAGGSISYDVAIGLRGDIAGSAAITAGIAGLAGHAQFADNVCGHLALAEWQPAGVCRLRMAWKCKLRTSMT